MNKILNAIGLLLFSIVALMIFLGVRNYNTIRNNGDKSDSLIILLNRTLEDRHVYYRDTCLNK